MNWQVITDGQLLGIFVTGRHAGDEAFEELVRRHLDMVFGTCRRILHHRDDAHDAAQATFQALAEKGEFLQLTADISGVAFAAPLRQRVG